MDTPKSRCGWLDTLRGFTVLSMVVYHTVWDLVYLFGMPWDWFYGTGALLWERCICCTFILLSGFCAGMGHHTWQRGLIVSGLGAVISLVTSIFMPESRILCGVLTLLGSCMITTGLLKPLLVRCPALLGMVMALALFGLTYHVPEGKFLIWDLPEWLGKNTVTAFLGFMPEGFFSADYFPLLPWGFLFLGGFFLYQLAGQRLLRLRWKGLGVLNFIGRHALIIYVLHQPVIYGLLWLADFLYGH